MHAKTPPNNEKGANLLPDLCSNAAVVGLIITGELLALALTLVQTSLDGFSWVQLGYVSLLVQWIILLSAAVLCRCGPIFLKLSPLRGGVVAYAIVLLVALVILSFACWLIESPVSQLLRNMLLAAIFAGLFLRYLYLQQQLRLQQQAELHSRIQALHARIRPHFLFNAMNTVASLIPIKPELAEKMVEDLCQLFRISLQETALVPLGQEIAWCRNYIDIEQVRIGERLKVVWQGDWQEVKEVLVPSLILQPLVENAICHGIGRLPEGGGIKISIESNGQQLVITMTNPMPSGEHTSKDTLADIKHNAMALNNIRHRLQAHYQGHASITTDAQTEQFRVTLVIPCE